MNSHFESFVPCYVANLPKFEYLPSFAKAVILHPKSEIVNLFLYYMANKTILSFMLACSIGSAFAQGNTDATTGATPIHHSQDSLCIPEDAHTIYGDLNSFSKWRIGGYGEVVAAFKKYGTNRFYGNSEGNPKENRNTIAIPRVVIAGDYKFNSKWILGVEVEFEAGGTGTSYELENTENGEYETEVEKGGEVALEQLHITRLIHRAFNVRAGHIIVPVGLTNNHHEPNQFFGTVRPEGETTIIPSTWHETGLEFFGNFGKGYAAFDYEAMIVTGLNANGFDRNKWAGGGKQGKFEVDNFTCPAFVARLNWHGVKGLRLGTSFYYCSNVGGNADKSQTYAGFGKTPVRIYTLDGQYRNQWVEARTNFMWGNLTNSSVLSAKNGKLSNKSGYSRLTPVAHKAVSYGGEAGLKIKVFFNSCPKFPDIIPFVRYEYYNSQENVVAPYNADDRLKVGMFTAGINWRPLPCLVIKGDYTTRRIGSGKYNSENEFAIGIAYTGWFAKK